MIQANTPARRHLRLALWVGMAILIVVLFHQQGNKIDENTARSVAAKQIAISAKKQSQAIQAVRVRNIRDNCEDINARSDNTVKQLNILVMQAPPERRMQAKASHDSTVILIRAILPKRDCDEEVRLKAK